MPGHPNQLPPEIIREIRRLFYEENLSKRRVAHKTGLSYNTVAKYIPVTTETALSNEEKYERFPKNTKPIDKKPPDTPIGSAFVTHKPSKDSKVPAPELPEPIKRDSSIFVIDTPGNWLILSDIHLPFHDRGALRIAVKKAVADGIVGILLNGDTIDCFGLSSKFHKALDGHMFETELEQWEGFAKWLRYCFPKIRIIYKRGNHEERYEPYLGKFPEIFGIKNIQFENVMQFEKFGVEDVKDRRIILLGDVPVLHGHEISNGGVNPARSAFTKLINTAIVGHSHRSMVWREKNIFGKYTECFATGAMCGLSPFYLPINKWDHGFAIVNVGRSGKSEINNHVIIEGVLR